MASRNAGWRAVAIVLTIGVQAEPVSADEKPDNAPANAEQVSLDQMSSALAEQLECLALNIYWEARSEPTTGQLAVASVTLNRVAHPRYPDSVCEVVYQGGEGGKKGCQFSWWCDGKPDRPRNAAAWAKAVKIALLAASAELPDPTGGALWYHADYVDPRWARSKLVVARIGRHLFFREGASDARLLASAR
jgi:spore germination cell wall hydrolase CwlJ-like protein